MAVRHDPKRFTVEQFDRMIEAGILGPEDRVELIDGEVLEMAPIGFRHAGCVNRLTLHFVQALAGRATVAVQNPARVSDLSQPQPDLVIAHLDPEFYGDGHPGPDDVLLIVEVADTTGVYDRTTKASLYARAGIAEYWLVDLPGRCVEVYRSPSASGYGDLHRAGPGETIAPGAFPDVTLEVGSLF